jgi:hypothetical protein
LLFRILFSSLTLKERELISRIGKRWPLLKNLETRAFLSVAVICPLFPGVARCARRYIHDAATNEWTAIIDASQNLVPEILSLPPSQTRYNCRRAAHRVKLLLDDRVLQMNHLPSGSNFRSGDGTSQARDGAMHAAHLYDPADGVVVFRQHARILIHIAEQGLLCIRQH